MLDDTVLALQRNCGDAGGALLPVVRNAFRFGVIYASEIVAMQMVLTSRYSQMLFVLTWLRK